jgi:hypothetical protein
MDSDHAHFWVQPPPPAPIQTLDDPTHQPSPDHRHEKIAPDDMLLLGMVLYMEQGLALDWLYAEKEKEDKDREHSAKCGHHHS